MAFSQPTPTAGPRQAGFLGRRVLVTQPADPAPVGGVVVRDDAEPPYVVLILLDDGRYVLGRECRFLPEACGAT